VNKTMTKRFYLTGFMTSGKSTIGPILANVLGWDFYDLDKSIEEEYNKTIVEIFDEFGEEKFRKIENEFLTRYSKLDEVVIALGGGTIASDENIELMQKTGKIIYLRATPEMIYKRIKNKTDRPLFRDLVLSGNKPEDFIKRITDLLSKREKYYNKADIILDTDNRPVGITVDKLAKLVKRYIYE